MAEQLQSDSEDYVLTRAKQAHKEGDIAYARFLCKEAITINPNNTTAWELLFNLRTQSNANNVIKTIKFGYFFLKLLIHIAMKRYIFALYEAYNMLGTNPTSNIALQQIIRIANKAGYYRLIIAIYEHEENIFNEIDDLIIVARAYLSEKIFDRSAKIAKECTLIAPDNEELKDILWKASVERHMNSDVALVTSDNNTRFVPPKIDAEKIFISSHKDDTNKSNKEQKS